MQSRTNIIQSLIDANGYESYLEIGIGDWYNFNTIKAKHKVAVDPQYTKERMDSDTFFAQNKEKFSIIFIDGLHHSDQVERDIVNSYKVLNKGGVILIHDCNPWEEVITRIPRETVAWTGDVFRPVTGFIKTYGGKIKTRYFEERTGLFAIFKTGTYSVKEGFNMPELLYEDWLRDHREEMMSK